MTAVLVSVTWTQIATLPPGAVREDLAYQYKRRRAALHAQRERDARTNTTIAADAERHRVTALRAFGDTPTQQAARRRMALGLPPRDV